MTTPSRRCLIALATTGAVLLSTACGAADDTATTDATPAADTAGWTVEHALGSTEIPATPERVVVLDSGELDIAVSLGIIPVGATDTRGLLEELAAEHGFDAAEVADVGAIAEPNLEAVAALQPDLILTNAIRDEEIYPELTAIAPTVVAADLGNAWKENLTLHAQALGREDEAALLLGDYEQRVDELAAQWGDPAGTEISVLRFLGGGEVRAYARGSFIGGVLHDVGFVWPEVIDTDDNRVELAPETITQADADVIFWSPGLSEDGSTEAQTIRSGQLWGSMSAVAAGSTYEVDDARWFLGLGPTGASFVLSDLEEISASR